MISGLELKNFKCFENMQIDLKKCECICRSERGWQIDGDSGVIADAAVILR